jgi:ABC-type branched-subunit amino acid transport system ATPase component
MMFGVERLEKSFGGFQVVNGCSLALEKGEIVGLIGPNGAGKTTFFNLICGSLEPDGGDVFLDDRRITGWPSHRVASQGLVRTFQVPLLFDHLSTIENLLVGIPLQAGERFWNVWLRPRVVGMEERSNEDDAWSMLAFLNLTAVANQAARVLSGGQRKLLELGRALMTRPRLLLLDEPVSGVNPVLAQEIAARIRTLRDRGYTLLIIEHNMDFIMDVADRLYVMANGTVLREGRPDDIRVDRAVLDAYLGVG